MQTCVTGCVMTSITVYLPMGVSALKLKAAQDIRHAETCSCMQLELLYTIAYIKPICQISVHS